MYNVASTKSQDSPKTPGGISKALLTPCRRVGLSRKWKKGGISPFISPLTTNNKEEDSKIESINEKNCDVSKPLRKRSRTLLASLNETDDKVSEVESDIQKEQHTENLVLTPKSIENEVIKTQDELSTPVTHLSKSKRKSFKNNCSTDKETPKLQKPKKTKSNNKIQDLDTKEVNDFEPKSSVKENIENTDTVIIEEISTPKQLDKQESCKSPIKTDSKNEQITDKNKIKTKSPNDLSKECIVVIQNNLFKNSHKKIFENKPNKNENKTSQTLFDSDDEPLINLNKEKHCIDDDDFVENKPKVRKLNLTKTASQKPKNKITNFNISDDEDFETNTKKTIVIRKTYEKVTKPTKAKSTGSITQKDIDNLKLRIEAKKKQLLAKSMNEDTKELRDLIKRWQKGCQGALLELMDLIKMKCPENSSMDYSEILKTLKIPPNLVGYDADTDCFVTPDDESVILASIDG